jgi:hypothetical protein
VAVPELINASLVSFRYTRTQSLSPLIRDTE